MTADDLKAMLTGNDTSMGKESLSLLHKLPDISKPIEQFQILPAKEFPLDEGRRDISHEFCGDVP
ncbi:hypothetical protein PKHYL_27830 [Psychrobacter sp. KH172YL61]|nr:hypothetical protein PKHYL_27830 [Psychrobacter sp. KH172YL61]